MWKKNHKKQSKNSSIDDDISLNNFPHKAKNANKEDCYKKLPVKFVPKRTIIPDYSPEFLRNYVDKIYIELNS